METDEKKKYKAQVFCLRVNKEDEPFMNKNVLLVSSQDEKWFGKHHRIDHYFVVMKVDKITMLIRQTTDLRSIKYLVGYGVEKEVFGKNDSFCEFQVLIDHIEIGKSKFPSEYKQLFKNREKRIEKLDDFQGMKLKDLLFYPQDYMKDLNFSKNEYIVSKKQDDTESESSSDSSSSDSSDDSSESSDEDSRDKKRHKDKKIKRQRKDKDRQRRKRRKKEKEREREKKKKNKQERSKKIRRENEKKHRRNRSRSRDRNKRGKDDKKRHRQREKRRD